MASVSTVLYPTLTKSNDARIMYPSNMHEYYCAVKEVEQSTNVSSKIEDYIKGPYAKIFHNRLKSIAKTPLQFPNLTQLTEMYGNDDMPQYHPLDSNKVVFASEYEKIKYPKIYQLDIPTKGLKLIPFTFPTTYGNPQWMTYPKFSPDGQYIAINTKMETGANTHELFIGPSEGGEVEQIPTEKGILGEFAWPNDVT
jgi:hypothetical protein